MCLYPRLVDNPKYKRNKKNGGVIPPLTDQRVKYVPIGCQTCLECRKQKSREWLVRLQEDIKTNKNGKFVTLTFSTKSLQELTKPEYKILKHSKYKFVKAPLKQPYIKQKRVKYNLTKLKGYDLDNAIAIKAVRLFLERWRKKYGKSLRHWLVTELGHGKTEHIHLHGIVWTDNIKDIEQIWKYGTVWRGHPIRGKKGEVTYENYVNNRTVNYMTKYITKMDVEHLNYKALILTSAGIGNNYIKTGNAYTNRYQDKKTVETYRTGTGHKISMPIYWRNKIYTDKERELLWIKKIDENKRWICGEMCKADDDKTYYNLLNYHRQRTHKLGYTPPEFIWKAKQYEERRRELIHERRLQRKPSKKETLSL